MEAYNKYLIFVQGMDPGDHTPRITIKLAMLCCLYISTFPSLVCLVIV